MGNPTRDTLFFYPNHHNYTWDALPGTPSFFIRITTSIRGAPYLGYSYFIRITTSIPGTPYLGRPLFYPNHHKYNRDTRPVFGVRPFASRGGDLRELTLVLLDLKLFWSLKNATCERLKRLEARRVCPDSLVEKSRSGNSGMILACVRGKPDTHI